MADAADANGRILMERFHWRYHPVAARMKEIIDSGALGKVEHIEGGVLHPPCSRPATSATATTSRAAR